MTHMSCFSGSIGALCDPSQGKPGNVSWLQNETLPTMPQT